MGRNETTVRRSAAIPWLRAFAIFSVAWGVVACVAAFSTNWFLALAQLSWGVVVAVMAVQITHLLEKLSVLELHMHVNLDDEVAKRLR
ncbi:MAG: hypothetical protein ACM3OO_03375 [Planctomycetaceae bacterium]